MATRKSNASNEFEDSRMAIKVELKKRIEISQAQLVGAIGENFTFSTRQVQALCTDIEDFKRILVALDEVKL